MQTPPRLDLGNPPQPQPVPHHFPPPPYREEPVGVRPRSGVARFLPTLVTLSAFGGLALLAWFAYQEGQAPLSEDDLPVIKAEGEPFKHAPENPGGEEIPHTDKEVYNSFTGEKPLKKAEIVPDSERPMDSAFLKQFSGVGEDENGDGIKQESVAFGNTASEKEPEDFDDAKAPLEPKPLPLAKATEALPTPNTGGVEVVKKIEAEAAQAPSKIVAAKEPVATVSKPAVVKPKAPATKKAVVAAKPKTASKAANTKVVSASDIRIQLGALRSEAEATREWKKIQGKHTSALSGLGMMVQKVDIPGKGTLYRLQAGPLASKDAARNLCKKLVAAGQGCFVAK